MSNSFVEILRDEILRTEIGAEAASGLAVENLELSTGELSRSVRGSVIVRRASGPGLSANLLRMDEVRLPAGVMPGCERIAA